MMERRIDGDSKLLEKDINIMERENKGDLSKRGKIDLVLFRRFVRYF